MIKLKTECNKCYHQKVCKNKDHAKQAVEKLSNTTYGNGPNNDYGWDIMSDHLNIKIEFSCLDYEERRLK